jgi:hypothetical protein
MKLGKAKNLFLSGFSLLLISCSNDKVKTGNTGDSLLIDTIADGSLRATAKTDSLHQNLIKELQIIYHDDQFGGREEITTTYNARRGDKIAANDYKNLEKVKVILDKYGWLGPDEIGVQGNTTLFLVIQHADIKTQEKYLPMMKDAAKKGKASAADLAYLTDRIEVRNGRPQVYGTQLSLQNGRCKPEPILDSANVNKR